MSDMTREELLALCWASFVPQEKWRDRDSASAQRQVGELWTLLRAGCRFEVLEMDPDLPINERTVWVRVSFDGFQSKENGQREMDRDTFYLPCWLRLEAKPGEDWY
jgi:hypothetical protein